MAFLDSIDLGLIEFTFFCSVILFASIVRGFSGFGFSASSISLLSFILPAKEIVPIILLLEIIASFLMIISCFIHSSYNDHLNIYNLNSSLSWIGLGNWLPLFWCYAGFKPFLNKR